MYNTNGNALEILVKNRPITEFPHQGITYVEGRKGSDYVIRFRNNSSTRKKVIISVDGLNVISGDINWQNGYVVDPWGVLDVPGWRKDDKNVAKFKFSSVGKSYNQHNDHGDVGNVGVIGAKVFHEQPVSYWKLPETKIVYEHHHHYPYQWTWYPTIYYGGGWNSSAGGAINNNILQDGHSITCDSFSGGASATQTMAAASYTAAINLADIQPQNVVEQQSLGTAYGKNKEFKTQEVNYVFNTVASDTLLIYYDTREGLERRGINVHKRAYKTPDAFPAYTGIACPPPK